MIISISAVLVFTMKLFVISTSAALITSIVMFLIYGPDKAIVRKSSYVKWVCVYALVSMITSWIVYGHPGVEFVA
jgi:hypothetical protein